MPLLESAIAMIFLVPRSHFCSPYTQLDLPRTHANQRYATWLALSQALRAVAPSPPRLAGAIFLD